MKKAIAVLLSMLFALPLAFASIDVGSRITTYDEGDQIVGLHGYADVSNTNTAPDVFVCATKDGNVIDYGMNIENDGQLSRAIELVKQLAKLSFAGFDHYGCLRARV